MIDISFNWLSFSFQSKTFFYISHFTHGLSPRLRSSTSSHSLALLLFAWHRLWQRQISCLLCFALWIKVFDSQSIQFHWKVFLINNFFHFDRSNQSYCRFHRIIQFLFINSERTSARITLLFSIIVNNKFNLALFQSIHHDERQHSRNSSHKTSSNGRSWCPMGRWRQGQGCRHDRLQSWHRLSLSGKSQIWKKIYFINSKDSSFGWPKKYFIHF